MSGAAVKTTCPYCGVGCGIVAARTADGAIEVKGDPEHPANFGRLCSKGSALAETLSLDDRVLSPLLHGRPTTWDTALDLVAARFQQTIARHGSGSVAFYVSGQILTEDYYVANKLMKGYIGSANIDTNSRLCMASSVAGHKRAFGSDTVPGCYEDFEEADLVVLTGSNLAWCHPVLYQRLVAAKEKRGTKIVVIDPRQTATTAIADLHLALSPGSDVALFNGLLMHLAEAGGIDARYVWRHTSGLLAAIQAAGLLSREEIARVTGLPTSQLIRFYELFAATPRAVTIYSQGVNQSTAGTDKVNAIINCHLATGRIGRPGMGSFSDTGQPNAMGGREVGGLANMLAAHMELADPSHRAIVQNFWGSPRIADAPGLKAVDMFRALGDGRIKALWIMATNPVASMPDAEAVRAAIAGCPFVVVSDVTRDTDTTALAHVLLPSLAWGEKDGTVTNSERRISRQRAFLAPPGEARADWWQMAEVAKRMGWRDAFDYADARAIFREYAGLTGCENQGTRDLDISGLADLASADYDRLEPVQWPLARQAARRDRRFFADGGFFTPDRRGRFVATPYRAATAAEVGPTYPLTLNTGRLRDQWHTMTRTAKAPRLMSHMAEPFLEIHPDDAAALGLGAADLAEVTSAHGSAVLRVLITDRQQVATVFAPIHWTAQQASRARIDALIAGDVDPVSGQPELKLTPVRVLSFGATWHAFALSVGPLSRATLEACGLDYWALARTRSGWRMEFAGLTAPDDWSALARDLVGGSDAGSAVDLLAYHDPGSGQHRFAAFAGARLVGALFVSAGPVSAARDYLAGQLGRTFEAAADRYRLLAARAPSDRPDPGPIVCACLEVGRNEIAAAIRSGLAASIDAVGSVTRAGTNCGSCRAEIGGLLHATRIAKAG